MKTIYRQHAVQRMHERGITEPEIEQAIADGEVIKSYPDDTPYPSVLVLARIHGRAIHIVYSVSEEDVVRMVITAYEPAPELWLDDMKTRRAK
jgi:Domain of unknown function (DUF4258)